MSHTNIARRPTVPPPNKVRSPVRALLRWYRRNGRALPWRSTADPYRILLSEIMLQQTQVGRVLEKYPLFLRRFPTFRSLARARQDDVVRMWRGMGYNNRAVRLHRLARAVVERFSGRLPDDQGTLRSLPGIGPYTAAAIQATVFGRPVTAIDVNVRRVLSRLSDRMPHYTSVRPEREIHRLAERLLPRRNAHDWNQALMDLGATICTARAPRCTSCPVVAWCASAGRMTMAAATTGRQEPSRGGIPNRIYRGRIVEMLRRSRTRRTPAVIGRAIYARFSDRDAVWLAGLLAALERDGLIAITMGGRRIALR